MMASKSLVFRFDNVEVREREFSLTQADKVLTIEPKAFRTLLFLLRNPQRLISKEELLNSVWGDAAVTEGSLTRCIWLLRSTLGDDIRSPRYIETVATVGYRFICPVVVLEDTSGEPESPEESNHLTEGGKKAGSGGRLWGWVLAGVGVLVLCLASAIWYLSRPLHEPRVTEYTQITHDGHKKYLAGTDGSRLYINRSNENNLFFDSFNGGFDADPPASISEVAISGGGIAQIPVTVPNAKLVDISADGLNLLILSAPNGHDPTGPLWDVKTVGGQARRLGEAVGASFSPDGNSVAYSTPKGEIWLMRNDGTGAKRLAAIGVGVYVADIAWSPDGNTIRFTKDSEIWEMSSSGSNPHPAFPGRQASFEDCCGRWTPNGKFFVFRTRHGGSLTSETEIWILDERRGLLNRPPTGPVQLAGGPIRWGRPIPSKDGSKIFAEGQTPRGEFSRFDTKTRQFQPFLGGISVQGAVFSKDGKYVAYVSFPEAILWKANRDGSNPVQLTDSSMWPILPRWSPDGAQIAFTATTASTAERMYVVSSDGSSPPRFIADSDEWREWPYWSPDGHRIAFDSDSIDQSGNVQQVIRILDLDSHQVSTVPGSVGLNGPRFSPDGRYLSAGSQDRWLMIFDFKTQQWSALGRRGFLDSAEWSRDGKSMYVRCLTGDLGIFRVSVKTGEPEKIVDLKDFHDAGWYGAYMGLDPTDAPLMLRDIGSDDIYALTLEQK